jgi:transposase
MLQSRSNWDIPEETVRVAQATYPQGNKYMRLRDELGVLYEDGDFADLFRRRGRPANSPGVLAMVTVMQFAEGLTDRQAAEAVRSRIDWKYALGLELTDTGFAHSVLTTFRQRLLDGGAEKRLLEKMLEQLREAGWLTARGRQRTDATHVYAAIRELNRLELVGETMRKVLNDLATVVPEWIQQQVTPDWFELYGPRFENYRLPQKKQERVDLQRRIGADGLYLLRLIYSSSAPNWVWELPGVQILRRVWIQQYYLQDETLFIRAKEEHGLPPNKQIIESPYDPEARNRTKRETNWTGYKVHLTESCDADQPNLITHVATTVSSVDDTALMGPIHDALAAKGLLPAEHFLDGGYSHADGLVESQEKHQVEVVAPVTPDPSWQAHQEDAYDLTHFTLDWEQQVATCPQGQQSISWRPHQTPAGRDVFMANFSRRHCGPCAQRQRCVKGKGARRLTVRPQKEHQALQEARRVQKTDAFKERYHTRAGIEGAISQGVRAFGLRYCRYIGLAKTRLQHVATGAAMNLTRLAQWLDDIPKAKTRQSRFAALAPAT